MSQTATVECKLCGRILTKHSLRAHMTLVHGTLEAKWRCDACPFKAMSEAALNVHVASAHLAGSNRNFKCQACGHRVKSIQGLRAHEVSVHADRKFACELCDEAFGSRGLLNKHFKAKHIPRSRKHTCHFCGYAGKTKQSLESHMTRKHVPDEEKTFAFTCKTCFKGFLAMSELNWHRKRWHSGEGATFSQECPVCPYAAFEAKSLRLHIRSVHLPPAKNRDVHECKICGKAYGSARSLEGHVSEVHDNPKHYPCLLCDKAFGRVDFYKSHMRRVHMETQGYSICKLCPPGKRRKRNLKDHLRTFHHKDRPFPCTKCEYRAPGEVKLKMHVKRVHLKVKDFECDLCGKKFCENYELKSHAQAHLKKIVISK